MFCLLSANKGLSFVLLISAMFSLLSCSADGSELKVNLKGHEYSVELADDAAERARGLMFRRELPKNKGMLFVFDQEEPQQFWMRHCYIALDILYFDAQKKFINGHFNVPPCQSAQCPTYPSTRPAKYVLELGGYVARELALGEGDLIELPESL